MRTGASESIVDFSDTAFLDALNKSMVEMEGDAVEDLRASAKRIERSYKSFLSQHKETGALLASAGTRSGKDKSGPYVEVGIIDDVVKTSKTNKADVSSTRYRKARGAGESVSTNEEGHLLEFGSRHQPPRPGLRTAVAQETGAGGAVPSILSGGPVKGSTYRKGANAKGKRGQF